MRYLTPLLPAGEMRQSKTSSKSRKVRVVNRSSRMRGFDAALRQPSSIDHASPGGVFLCGSTHPFMDFPSNRRIQPADFSSEVNGSVGEVKKAFEDGKKDAVASGGQKLEALFKEVEVFFTQKSAADAVEFAKNVQVAAKELLSEATSGTKAGAQAAFAKITGACKGCHDAHREK